MSTALSDNDPDTRPATPLAQDDLHDQMLPRRPKRRWLNGPSATVLALVTCAIGFYGGVRVEKSHASSSSAGGTGAAGFARRFAAAGATGGTSGASAKSGSTSKTGATGATGAAGGGSFPGGAGGFGGGTSGTVSSIDGRTLVLDETGGDKVTVKLSSATKYSKTVSVTKGRIYPGDTISVSGVTAKSGTISATSVTDSGDSSTSTSSSSTGSSSSSSSGSSRIRSLFGGG